MTPSGRECLAFRDDLAAAATGTLTGRRRAELLDHLEECPSCTAALEGLSSAVDSLMTLVPDAAPSEGFADRAIARMVSEAPASRSAARTDLPADPGLRPASTVDSGSSTGSRPPERYADRRQRSRRLPPRALLATAAVVVLLAAGVGIGALVGASHSPGPGAHASVTAPGVRTATLHSSLGPTGSVLVAPGHPGAWLVMTVDDVGAPGTVTCRVTLADGSRRVVGSYPLNAGYGSWAARLPVSASSLRAVELLDEDGATLAVAKLARNGG